MFSPIGKKKRLIEQKFSRGGERVGSSSPRSRSPTRGGSISPRSPSPSGSLDDTRQRMKLLAPTSMIAASGVLERALSDPGMTGVVMKRILEATARYRPGRDAITLKAFEAKTLEYSFFRQNLSTAFWLTFTDDEFQAVIEFFDPTKAGIIDGYSFMIAFTRLAAMRKDNEAQIVREKQEAFMRNKQAEEERDKIEKEKRNDLAVDYNFNEASKKSALRKLEQAAKNFDPYHPASPSTAAFEVRAIKAAVFKEMLKLTFNLKVDRAELGAILKEFCEDELQEVPSSDFLRFFFRVGFDAREEDKRQQRIKQALLDKKAEEEREKKALEAKNKTQLKVDYNFTPADEVNATEKLRIASQKYDRSATGAVALDGFDCDELSPSDFRELLKRVFNVVLTNTELGYVLHKYDIKKSGCLHCKTFLTAMLQLGRESRHKSHIDQIQKQRKLIEQAEKEHVEKMLSVQKDERVAISEKYSDSHLQSAINKLTDAAVRFDKVRGGSLESFQASHLDLVQFKRGLKRTFNLTFTAYEMGAMLDFLGVGEDKMVDCHRFLTTFTTLGAAERGRVRTEQLTTQRHNEREMKEEHERKIQENLSKSLYEVEFEFTEPDRDSALRKMIEAATKYDAAHPAAMSLQSFEKKFMTGPEFKEIVRRTFHLILAPKEVGALFKYFGDRAKLHSASTLAFDQIDCGEFLKFFLQVGVNERAAFHRQQLEKQRKESEEQVQEHLRKVQQLATRGTYQPDMEYGEEDKASITAKLLAASEKFDKNHPAAPSLEAFDAAVMAPGIFRENIKAIFGVRATPKEIGYLLDVYDKDKAGGINTKEFLIKFFASGKEIRDAKRKEALEKQRAALKAMRKDAEDKVLQLTEKSDYAIDPTFNSDDYYEAERRMSIASEKYDKMHPSAPNLDGFDGPVSAGAFRELMKRAFTIYLTPKEVGAILQRFHCHNDYNMVDGKKFIIHFIKLGFDARAKRKTQVLVEQRQSLAQMKADQEKKLLQAMQKAELSLVETFTDAHRDEAMRKLIDASALYDKNAPGCVSLDSFHAKFLTPGVFREVVKRTFNILWSPEELASMVAEFDNGRANVDTNKFLVAFIKMGADERDRRKAIQLEKQRQQNMVREAKEKMKLKKAEDKVALKVNYIYTDEEKNSAFEKLAAAAKKYDKAHPAAMSLQGFEEKSMKPHVFREMVKRTFNFLPNPGELGALMHYFDQKNTGEVSSYRFLVHFLKLGISERAKEHNESMKKLREDTEFRERFHREKLAAQWAKAELNVKYEFTEDDKFSAMQKLTEASTKFDPASPGPMGLTAFQASVLSPAVFREMLKRCFNMKLSNGELAALIFEFDKDGTKNINCADFMVTFTSLGFERRSAIRTAQLEKKRKMSESARMEFEEKQKQADMKMEANLDTNFTDEDFNSVLNKIRVLAANYDRSHPSAPSLSGFIGTDMKPNEFKHMMVRTFSCNLTSKELAALVAFFPSKTNMPITASAGEENATGPSSPSSQPRSRSPARGSSDGIQRINNRAFLAYFNKIQREEQAKRHKQRIARDRDFVITQKVLQVEEEKKRVEELQEQLAFTEIDEANCLAKIKQAAKEYATDSAPLQEPLQGFKGPALPPDKFRDLMARIFQIKFTFPEMGAMLSLLDHSGLGVFDGPRFLTWFYKLSRIEEKYLLGESEVQLTWAAMQRAATLPLSGSMTSFSKLGESSSMSVSSSSRSVRGLSRKVQRTASSDKRAMSLESDASSSIKRIPSHASQTSQSPSQFVDPFAEAFGFDDFDEVSAANAQSFSQATLEQAWFLPTVLMTTPVVADDNEEMRQHLKELFANTAPQRLSMVSNSQSQSSLDNLLLRPSSISSAKKSDTAYSKKLKSLTAYGRMQTAPKAQRSVSPDRPTGAPTISTANDEGKERDFLATLFSSNSNSNISATSPKKADKTILDPVGHLLNIKKHFKQAPKYVVLQKRRQQRELVPIRKSAAAAAGRQADEADEGDGEEAGGGGQGAQEVELQGGGFFFPGLHGSEEEDAAGGVEEAADPSDGEAARSGRSLKQLFVFE